MKNALKAEVKRLMGVAANIRKDWFKERDALKNEVEKWQKKYDDEAEDNGALRNLFKEVKARAETAEAALSKARPLLEAVGYYRQSIEGHYATKIERAMITTEGRKVLEAALAYRAAQAKKEGK